MAAQTERLAGGAPASGRPPGAPRRNGFADAPDLGADGDVYPALTAAQAQALRLADPSFSPWRVVGAQALTGLVCVAFAWAISERAGVAWSALYGAAATVLPSALMARGMTRGTRNAVASAAAFMFWELLKIGVAVAMMVIAVRVVPNLSWPALLATMVVCMKVNWFALLWRGPRPDNKA